MSIPILNTKLYIAPPRPNLVSRPRLVKQINEGLHGKLTLISAPAGFGKTTLISTWIAESQYATAWLSLDENDNDPTRFLTYLIGALQTVVPSLDELIEQVQSSNPPPPESALTELINAISTMSDNFMLVIDDYHLIDSKEIDDIIIFLLDYMPPQMHLTITTREDPQLPLTRLRAKNNLTEIRASDLRLTIDEANHFLNQTMGLNLTADDIMTLESRTEGWIVGLHLAAISLSRHDDTAQFIQSFTGGHHFVVDYLVEEVLQHQPQHVQSFLLYTSILDRLCGGLCDALLAEQSTSGQDTLEDIERANLLIVPLDDQRIWYRYHHLFADVLRAHLHKRYPAQVTQLHQRASVWYEQNQFSAQAIHHAIMAEDFERVARLLELEIPSVDEVFQYATWLTWVQTIPDTILHARPVLAMGYAWALLHGGELEAANLCLQEVEHVLAWADHDSIIVEDQTQFASLPQSIAIARAYLAQAFGDTQTTIKYAQRVLDLSSNIYHHTYEQAIALLGIAHWSSGNLETAYDILNGYITDLQQASNILEITSITYIVADITIDLGRLHEAQRLYEQTLQLLRDDEVLFPGREHLYRGLSELYIEWNKLETATDYLHTAERWGEKIEPPDWQYRLCMTQARLMAMQGKLDDALDLLAGAERSYTRTPLPDVRSISALKAQLWIQQGKLDEALAWAKHQALSIDDEIHYLNEFDYITLAKLYIAYYEQGASDESIHKAHQLLDRILKITEDTGRQQTIIQCLILQALAYSAQDNPTQALNTLERALTLAEPQGYIRIFVDEGVAMARLLRDALSQGIATDYINQLLSAFTTANLQPQTSSVSNTSENYLDELTERELEILQHIAKGLTNPEIAEHLYISNNTVKVHSRNIYSKLDVTNRTQAVAKARTLGILPLN